MAAAPQSGAPLGAKRQRSRPAVTPLTGSLATPVAALRAASAAPFAAWVACPPTAPTIAPKPAPALATPCCIQFPNTSKKPCRSEGAGVGAGAATGASGPGGCAVAVTQKKNMEALNASGLAAARTAILARSGSRRCARSGFVCIDDSGLRVSLTSYPTPQPADKGRRHGRIKASATG